MQRYFTDPYRLIPPYESTFWCRLAGPLSPWFLRRRLNVHRWELRGVETLRNLLAEGAGVLLTPNHCRWADPLLVGQIGRAVGRYFHYAVSYHMFRQSRVFAWWLNRIGGYSIHREGVDRESLRAGVQLLTTSSRPLVIFPEGTWYRQNDRLGPLLEGVALIARQAARQARRPIFLLPVAIKYWMLDDPRSALDQWLTRTEASLRWEPQHRLDLVERIEKLSGAFLATKEIEYIGRALPGLVEERRQALIEIVVTGIESAHGCVSEGDTVMGRIRRLRQVLVARLPETAAHPAKTAELQPHLARLLFCEALYSHSHTYLCERPSHERLTEAVERLEEILRDQPESPLVRLGAVVEVGEPLPVPDRSGGRAEGRHLVEEIARSVQQLLDGLLAQGPPAAWHCPPRAEETTGSARTLPTANPSYVS